jgi:hypothetical protein
MLQEVACDVLCIFIRDNVTAQKKSIETGGMEVLLAAINNHLGCATLCRNACAAMSNIASDSKENTGLLIGMCVTAVVVKVKNKWPDDTKVQRAVKRLTQSIIFEMNSWMG